MAIADSTAVSHPKYWSEKEFKQNISALLVDIRECIKTIQPAELPQGRMHYNVSRFIGSSFMDEVEGKYNGYLEIKTPFYKPNKRLVEFNISAAGEPLEFRILVTSLFAPILDVLEKHKNQFGKINIKYGPEK